MNNIYLKKLQLVASTEYKRKHFRYTVREVIKHLPEEDFLPLLTECLHSNHYPLLIEYIKIGQRLHELTFSKVNVQVETCCIKQEIINLKYLFKSHRKTLTTILTTLSSDGYSPEVTEWLVIHKFWS